MTKRSLFVCLDRAECSRLTSFMNKMTLKGNRRVRLRAKAVLLSHRFRKVKQIAEELGCSARSVYTWLRRYLSACSHRQIGQKASPDYPNLPRQLN